VKVQLVGHPGQVRQRSGFHLSHDLAAMDFTSDLADADLVAICLLRRPVTTMAITSRSRRVRVSKARQNIFRRT
jgi:hypothetical protein